MQGQPKGIGTFFSRLRRRRLFRRAVNFSKWLLFILLLLVAVLFALLQNKRFQNYLTGEITTYLSTELNTRVEVDRLNFDLLDEFVLEGFYVEDLQGDTLLYSRELRADFNRSMIALLWKRLDIKNVYLTDAQFNIRRDSAELNNNLNFIASFFSGGSSSGGGKKQPLLVNVDGIYLDQVRFLQDDQVRGQLIDVMVQRGEIQLESIDMSEQRIAFNSIKLESPEIIVIEKPKFPAPKVAIVDAPPEVVEVVEQITQDSTVKEDEKSLLATIDAFLMTDAHFIYHNYRRSAERNPQPDIIDYNHLDITNINIDIDSFQFQNDIYKGQVNGLTFREFSGFELSKLSASQAVVSDSLVGLYGLELVTPASTLGDTLELTYKGFRDFKNYNNKVKMVGHFNNAQVAVKDIMAFAPPLKRNAFFLQNQDEVLQINGEVTGTVNRLRGRDLDIRLGRGLSFRGRFSSRNLAVRNEERLNLKVEQMRTSFQTLRLLVPRFNPPENFDKLGQLDFNGRFDGFFTDFVAFGKLKTALGNAEMDMNMNTRYGREQANYRGKLSLYDFDLGGWSGNKDLGNITFVSEVKNGVGLTLETVDAELEARIQEFSYRGYRYENLTVDGELQKNLFDGNLVAKDDNIDFVFNGKLDFIDSLPRFDFQADVNRLDLAAINLSKQPIVLSGGFDLNLEGEGISSLQGNGSVYNLNIQREKENFLVDTLLISSTIDSRQYRIFDVYSDVLELQLDGYFDVQEVPQVVTRYFVRNFPEFADRFRIRSKEKPLKDSRFNFEVRVPNSKNFTNLLAPGLDTIRYASASGYVDNVKDSIRLEVEFPVLNYRNLRFDDVLVRYKGIRDSSDMILDIYHTSINENQHFEPIKLEGQMVRDTFHFNINSTNFTSIFDDLDLRGKLYLLDSFYQVSFLPSNLVILKDRWNILEDNYIRFGKGKVETRNFDLTNFEKRIVVQSIGDKGLTMSLENFDLSLIDDWWKYSKMDFSGNFFVLLEVGDIFKLEDVYATALADSFLVNQDNWGELRIDLGMKNIKSPLQASVNIAGDPQNLNADGEIYLNEQMRQAATKGKPTTMAKDEFKFTVRLDDYPLEIIEYFLGNGVYDTKGTINVEVALDGRLKKPNINGMAYVSDLSTTINYLKTRYYVPEGEIKITNSIFDATGNYIYDKNNNAALVTGGITHDHLSKFRLNVGVNSEQFIFLDTKKGDNELYYGFGIGSGDVQFTGKFQATDIKIDAKTGAGTSLTIPIDYGQDADEVSFIRFLDKKENTEDEERQKLDLKGVAIDMALEMTKEAEVQMIFDEQAGDIIKGNGHGNLQIKVPRGGDFEMFGDYDIDRGEYLFTWLNVVNKPFKVNQGGRISWDGDPFGAQIDIEASYSGLRPSLYNFILEYLQDDDIKAAARSPVDVDLSMRLRGELLKPEISFDLSFPTLTAGELKNYTDSKLRIVRQDQQELNRQVFGLLVIGGFLPNESSALAGTQGIIGINTVSELLSNQLSIYLTELLSEVFTDVGFISGVDFQIEYNVFQSDEIRIDGRRLPVTGAELELRQRFDLFNDRFTVDLSGSYVNQGGAFFAGDVILEYYLTRKRRLKVRFYRLSDLTIQGRRDILGLGFSVRREFDSFAEFISGLRRSAREVAEEDRPPGD